MPIGDVPPYMEVKDSHEPPIRVEHYHTIPILNDGPEGNWELVRELFPEEATRAVLSRADCINCGHHWTSHFRDKGRWSCRLEKGRMGERVRCTCRAYVSSLPTPGPVPSK